MSGSLRELFDRLFIVRRDRIADAELLWRAVYKKDQINKKTGLLKPSFFKDNRGLSCDLASLTTPEKSMRGSNRKAWPSFALAEFSAGDVRSQEVKSDIEHQPLSWWKNYAHCQFTTKLDTAQAVAMVGRSRFKVKNPMPENTDAS